MKQANKSKRPSLHDVEEPPAVDGEDRERQLSDLSDKALRKRLMRFTEEFWMLAGDQSQAAMTRRVELTRLMRGIQDVIDAREPLVEVRCPPSVTGEPFVVGPL